MPPTETETAKPVAEGALQFADVGGDVGRHLKECFAPPFRPSGYVSVTVSDAQPAKPVTMTAYFRELGPLVRNARVRDDDVWVVSFPKTG